MEGDDADHWYVERIDDVHRLRVECEGPRSAEQRDAHEQKLGGIASGPSDERLGDGALRDGIRQADDPHELGVVLRLEVESLADGHLPDGRPPIHGRTRMHALEYM